VHDIQGAIGLAFLNDARDVDLAGALRDHLNVDALLPQRAEEAAADADHAAQLAADERDDGHVGHEVDVAPDLEVVDGALERLVFDAEFFLAVPGQQGDLRVQGHGDVHFRRRDEVDAQAVLVQDAEDRHKEAVRASPLLAVHVKHGDAGLDRHGRRAARGVVHAQVRDRAVAEEACLPALAFGRVWEDDGAGVARVHHVLDADRDAGADHLVHGEGVDDLGAVEGQLGGLAGRDGVEEARGRHLARVGGENAVDLLPDLEFLGAQAHGGQSSAEIRVATADVLQQTAGDGAKVSSNDRDGVVAVFEDALGDGKGQVLVEVVVEALSHELEGNDVAEVDVDGVGAAVAEQSGHVQAAELLADGDDHVVGLVRDGLEELRALQDLEQLEALGVDLLGEVLDDEVAGDGILAGLDVVDADGLDNVAELLRVGFQDISGGAQEAVGGALALGRGAARRANDSSAVLAQACPVVIGQQLSPGKSRQNSPTPFPFFRNTSVDNPTTYSTMS
jgi:hypothetical protein